MNYYVVTIKKGGTTVKQYFDDHVDALQWLNDGFTATLDDPENTGTEYSIREAETKKDAP